MFNFINNFVLGHIDTFARIIAGMILVIIGIPLISFKGGIPRFAGIILNKGKAILALVVGFILTFFVVVPLGELLIKLFLQKLVDLTFPILLIALGIFILEWDLRMRWKFHWYWIPPIVIGGLWLFAEIFFLVSKSLS